MLVICAGMPKAGSTLQFNLCKELLGHCLEVNHGWVTGAQWAKGFRPDSTAPGGGEVILKCHHVPRWMLERPSTDDVRIVSTYRDLRDVAASAKEFEPHKSFEEILQTLDLTVSVLGQMDGRPTVLVQRYEAMIADLGATVEELAGHLGAAVDEARIASIAGRWHIESTQERIASAAQEAPPRRRGLGLLRKRAEPQAASPWDADTLLWPTHISSSQGKPGRYEGVLTRDELDAIQARYSDWLRSHAYN